VKLNPGEIDERSAVPHITHILWKQEVYCCVHMSPPTSGLCPEQNESSPQHHTLFL